MADLTAAFQGITTPLADLYHEIHQRGWQVTNVGVKDQQFVAEAKNPYGETAEKPGRDANTALAALLLYIVRREHIRQGAWNSTWTDQLEPIAQSYAKAPVFDPKAALAWKELADDSVARAKALATQLHVEVTDDPEPYESPQKLWEDVERKKHLWVTRANAQHPVWTEDQVLAFRICHDVLGHATAGADWGWTGQNLATAAHMPHLTPNAQRALFTETVGQAAYNAYHRGWGPPKICFLDDHLSPVQDAENPAGHAGEHPDMALVPSALPQRKAITYNTWEPGRPGKGIIKGDGNIRLWPINDRGAPHHQDNGFQWGTQDVSFDVSPEGHALVYAPEHQLPGLFTKLQEFEPNLQPVKRPWQSADAWRSEQKFTRLAGVRRDPNYQYSTGIEPPEINAVTSFGDPLEHMVTKDHAFNLDTGWAKWTTPEGKPDYDRMKQAIMNAFRAALLSPLKELRWNAAHYQDLQHIPYHISDPKVYWDALENARINHNRSEGVPNPEIAHKHHYQSSLDFYRYYQRHNPQLAPSELKEAADREILIMRAEIEEKLLSEVKDPDMEIFEPKVDKLLDRRLKQIVKDDKPLAVLSAENPYVQPKRYGGFIGRHLIAIAKVSQYADLLLEAALEDVKRHDGAGHVFRATTLGLGIPYVGPKVVSFVWLLLQPLTSQLATVDTHMADTLGYKHKDVANNRDYFRLERELMAGRDAAGYSHMPLGQFQWALWDFKRSGPGFHQDHSPLRAWQPTPHHQIEWQPVLRGLKGEDWLPPPWWEQTKPYREQEVAAWNTDVAPFWPKSKIPWQDAHVPVHVASDGTADELHLALEVPEWVRKKIAFFVGSLDLPESAELLSPNEYHITVAYSPHGVEDPELHHVLRQFNLYGLKFEGKGLTKLGDAGALVVELVCPGFNEYATRVNDWLAEHGVEVTRYDDGYTPHITVAYTEDDAPSEKLPPLSFRAGHMSFSTPRKAPSLPPLWARRSLASFAFGRESRVAHLSSSGKELKTGIAQALQQTQRNADVVQGPWNQPMECPRCGQKSFVKIETTDADGSIHTEYECKNCGYYRRLAARKKHCSKCGGNLDLRGVCVKCGAKYSASEYEIRHADEGWFSHDTGQFIPRYDSRGRDTLLTQHGQGHGKVAYFNGEPVASVTWQVLPDRIILGSAYTHPDHRGKGLFNQLTEGIRTSGLPVDALHWDNPMLKKKVRGWRKMADYQGWTNWDTWNTKLMMDNEHELYLAQEKMAEEGWTPEQIRDWAIEHVIGPHNAQAIADAKEWNSIPREERLDPHWEALKEKNPQAADLVDALGMGENIEDDEPTLMDPELVNWHEIHQTIMEDHNMNREYEEKQQEAAKNWRFFVTGHPDEVNHMFNAWMEHHGVDPDAKSWGDERARSEFGHTTFVPESEMSERATHITPNYVLSGPEEHAGVPMEQGKFWQENVVPEGGYHASTRDLAWEAITRIQRGQASNWQRQTMTNALLNQGHDGPAISQIMRPKFRWDPTLEKWENIEQMQQRPQVDMSLDKPGDLTLPEGWTSRVRRAWRAWSGRDRLDDYT